jgi:predicted RNase H-like HicB family nuclease
MRYYTALIHKDADSDYGVSFPDLPGLITAGETLEHASVMAREALALHLDGLAEDGAAIPNPSSLDAVMADPANHDGVAMLIAVPPDQRAVRVNVTLPGDVLHEIDEFAKARGFSRSEFLTRAAKRLMEWDRA